MKRKIRQAYIRGMIDLSVFLLVMSSNVYFLVYIVEKYL